MMNNQEQDQHSTLYEKRLGRMPVTDNNHLKLRNMLNIIFMLLAVVGVIVYFFINSSVGTIIVLVSMGFKMAECIIRLLFKS